MNGDRKKPGVAFWATVGLVAVVLYVLSLLPIWWLEASDLNPEPGTFVDEMLRGYCAPARWLISKFWVLGD